MTSARNQLRKEARTVYQAQRREILVIRAQLAQKFLAILAHRPRLALCAPTAMNDQW
jgi:hypothetical protein